MMAVLEEIPLAIKDKAAGATLVRDVRVAVAPDSFGDDALFIILVLSDPPAGHDTWPVEDLRELRQFVREYLGSRLTELGMPWFVAFEPEHPDLPEIDDEQLDLL